MYIKHLQQKTEEETVISKMQCACITPLWYCRKPRSRSWHGGFLHLNRQIGEYYCGLQMHSFFSSALNSNSVSNKLWEINWVRQDIKIKILSFLNYFVTHFKLKLKALCFCHTSLVSQKVGMYRRRQEWETSFHHAQCHFCTVGRFYAKYKVSKFLNLLNSLPVKCIIQLSVVIFL